MTVRERKGEKEGKRRNIRVVVVVVFVMAAELKRDVVSKRLALGKEGQADTG